MSRSHFGAGARGPSRARTFHATSFAGLDGAGKPNYVAELHLRAAAHGADFTVEEMGRVAHVFLVDDAMRDRHPEIGAEIVAIGVGTDHRGRVSCKEHDADSYARHVAPFAPAPGARP